MEDQKQDNTLSRANGILSKMLIAIIFLAPIFFLPFLSIEFSKSLLIFGISTVVLALTLRQLFNRTSFNLPKQALVIATLLLPFIFLLSALVTTASICKTDGTTGIPYPCFPGLHISIVGYGFESGTVGAIVLASLILLVVSRLFRSKEKVFYAELLFLSSIGAMILFQIIHLLIPSLTLGVFYGATANLIGKWNDMALFVGSGIVMSLLLLELLPLSKLFRSLILAVLFSGLALLLVVNSTTAWMFVGIFALLIGLYSWYTKKGGVSSLDGVVKKRKYPLYSLLVMCVAVVAILAHVFIGQIVSDRFNVNYTEVRPSWPATISITKEVFRQNLLFGTGPNKFINAWQSFKPDSINQEPVLWNADFDYGVGLIPTLVSTTGTVGLLAFVFFFVGFVLLGIKTLRLNFSDAFSRYIAISSYFLALYFWVVSIVYVPGLVVFFLAFVFSGMSLAILNLHLPPESWKFSFGDNSKKRFLYVLKITAVSIFVLCVGIYFVIQAISSIYFQMGLRVFNVSGDGFSAGKYITKAANLAPNDFYYRALADLSLSDINTVLSGDQTSESFAGDFQRVVLSAEQYATQAVQYNPRNFRNWIELALVYEAVIPTGNAQAYENAVAAYREALFANPKNPGPLLRLARLEAGLGSFEKAREYANIALQIKPNFSEVAFLLSQIEVETNNVDGAITTIQNAITSNPNDALLYFQLGLLRYDKKDYKGAVTAFDAAVVLVEDYANAKYFRGLSYVRLGNREQALLDFESILETNADNEEVKFIIDNIKNNKDPFANATPPIDDKPETREELPVEEN